MRGRKEIKRMKREKIKARRRRMGWKKYLSRVLGWVSSKTLK